MKIAVPRKVLSLFAFLLTIILSFGFMLSVSNVDIPVQAYETQCPDYMTDEQCLNFLQEQARLIGAQQQQIQGSLDAEKFAQLSLYEQISYLASQINQTELLIDQKQVEIETITVEINLLGKEIIKTQNAIDVIKQEIITLESTIKKRTLSSYKMSFLSPLEVILDSNNFEGLLRKMKYLIEAKKQDRQLLSQVSDSKNNLSNEQEELENKRIEIQNKRNLIEAEQTQLASAKKILDSQKAQQTALLAESQRREAEIRANLSTLQGTISALDAQILSIATRMEEEGKLVSQGYVGKGTVIGFMGNSGCIPMSAHLHYAINNNPNAVCTVSANGVNYIIRGEWCGTVSVWNYLQLGPDIYGYWGDFPLYYIYSSTFQVPLGTMYGNKPFITQTEHQGTAIDMSTGIPGTPVLAAAGGELITGYYDGCGGKFAKIRHSGGLVSVYLHLR